MVSEDLGIKLENVSLKGMGTAGRSSLSGRRRIPPSSMAVVRNRPWKIGSEQMRAQIEGNTSNYAGGWERLAKLIGGVAVINVGASRESQMKEKKAPSKDALNATHTAGWRRDRTWWRDCPFKMPVGFGRYQKRGRGSPRG